MSKLFSKLFIITIAAILPMSTVYAKNVKNLEPKTSIIRITSTDTNQPKIRIDGSILLSTSGKDANITEIHTTTPWEITVTEEYVRYLLKTDLQNSMIQVQTIEKTNHGDEVRVTSTGHVFDGVEANCDGSGCVTSGVTVLN